MPGAEGSPLAWVEDPPSFREIMEGHGTFFQIPHIVIRATVIPDTTRCDGYLIVFHDYIGKPPFATHRDYFCFANVRVNEYIVGEGPAYLTVALDRYTFFEIPPLQTWANDRETVVEHMFGNPAVGVAEAYEGREVILFMRPAVTRTVETWVVVGGVDVWFVLEDTGGSAVRGDSDGTIGYSAALRYEDEVVSAASLDDLVASVRAAAPVREAAVEATTTTTTAGATTSTTVAGRSSGSQGTETTTTSGSLNTAAGVVGTTLPVGRSTTGSTRGLPFIVDRADRLRDFYIAEGAVYEGEGATVLPPPAPISPGVPTNIEVSRVGNRLLLTWDPPGDRGEADSYYLWLVWENTQGTRQIFKDLQTLHGEPMLEITAMARVYGPGLTAQVRAENTYGTSDWSPTQTLTTTTTTTTSTSATTTTTSTTSTSATTTTTTV